MKASEHVIGKLRAYISIDDDGNEGIVAWFGPTGWRPLVGGYEDKFDKLEELARMVANSTGKPVHVIEFTTRTQVGVIQP